jgi:hypothetical protein
MGQVPSDFQRRIINPKHYIRPAQKEPIVRELESHEVEQGGQYYAAGVGIAIAVSADGAFELPPQKKE